MFVPFVFWSVIAARYAGQACCGQSGGSCVLLVPPTSTGIVASAPPLGAEGHRATPAQTDDSTAAVLIAHAVYMSRVFFLSEDGGVAQIPSSHVLGRELLQVDIRPPSPPLGTSHTALSIPPDRLSAAFGVTGVVRRTEQVHSGHRREGAGPSAVGPLESIPYDTPLSSAVRRWNGVPSAGAQQVPAR